MFLYELCRSFSSSTVTVLYNGNRLWFGDTHDLPSEYRLLYVVYADATLRKRFRNNQTDLYVVVQEV